MNHVPVEYLEDSQGRLVPKKQIKDIDLARDELVKELVAKAKEHAGVVAQFKADALGDIESFVDLSAEKYDAKIGGRKGNLNLTSFDGRFKIVRAIAEGLNFDERLQAAKALIFECFDEWTEGARSELKTLINDAFAVDKEGKISTTKVLSLRRLNFDHPKWAKAMEAINDSLQVTNSKTYIRFYERNESGKYEIICLDPTEL